MNDDKPQPPLEYRNYADDRPQRRNAIASFAGGMFSGVVLIGICGFVFGIATLNHVSTAPRNPLNASVYVFAIGALFAGVFGVVVLRGERRRFFLAGFLLGVALTCLIEGACFYAN